MGDYVILSERKREREILDVQCLIKGQSRRFLMKKPLRVLVPRRNDSQLTALQKFRSHSVFSIVLLGGSLPTVRQPGFPVNPTQKTGF